MFPKSFKRRKLRTTFAVLGVALGIGAMVSLNAITQGTIGQYDRMAAEFRGDIMVQRAGMPDPVLSQIDPSFIEKVGSLPGVAEANPVAFFAIKMLKLAKVEMRGTRFFVVTGVPAESSMLRRHRLISGRYFKSDQGEIILGETASKDLGISDGGILNIDGRGYRVVGRYKTGIRVLDKGALLSIGDLQKVRRTKNVNLIVVDLKDREADMQSTINEISNTFPDLEALKSSEVLDHFDQVRIFKNVAFGISLIAAAIAIVGILNTMFMSVYERTREIGILRAIGWSSGMVIRMILVEGIAISTVGGVLGLLLGIAGTEILIRTIDIGLLDASYPVRTLLNTFAVALVIGLIGSIFPALKAVRITPVEALRHE